MRRLVTLLVVAVTGVLLLGSGSTGAFLRDASGPASTVLRAGTLEAALTASGPVAVAGTNPSVLPVGATGLVPGTRAQAFTYTVTNSTVSAVPSSSRLDISTTATGAAYTALAPYLLATATPAGGTAQSLTVGATAVAGTVVVPGALAPGASTTVVVTLTLPAVSGTVDLGRLLLPQRSSAVVTLGATATLAQVPRTS